MARYRRPRPLSQRDDPTEPHGNESRRRGLVHENNGCAATAGAVALDYHTGGRVQTRGGALRHKLPDPDGSTPDTPTLNLGDIQRAWRRGWNEELEIAGPNQRTWDHIVAMVAQGRMVLVATDSGDLDGSCSEGQDTEHMIGLHPDTQPGLVLVHDPWCYRAGTNGLGRFRWLKRGDVKEAARGLGFQHGWTKRRSPKP